jgi:hypothetical protein
MPQFLEDFIVSDTWAAGIPERVDKPLGRTVFQLSLRLFEGKWGLTFRTC